MVADPLFAETRLAELYDTWCPWPDRGDFRFYLPLVMAARAVLDWDSRPLTDVSPEIITIARRSG